MTIRQNIRNAFFCETSATIYAEIEKRKSAKKACDIPPAKMAGGNFLVGEPYDHSASNGLPRFQMYRKSGNRYYVSNRPVTKIEFKNLLNIA